MALTKLTYTYEGTNVFALNFPLGYLDPAHITVRVNDEVTDRAFTFLTTGTIQVNGAALENGDVIVITRTVPNAELLHVFADGAAMTEENFDEAFKQSLMIAQEIKDGRYLAFSGELDMGNNKIVNVAPGVNPTDAVNVSQLGDTASNVAAAQAAQAAAEDAADAAHTDAVAAANSEEACAADAAAVADALETLTLGPSQPRTQTFTNGAGYTAGSSTTITITTLPLPINEDCITIVFDGLVRARDTYTYNSLTGVVTFNSTIGGGVAKIECSWWTSLVIGTPAPNSVQWTTHMKTSTGNKIPRWNSTGNPSSLDYLQEDDMVSNSNVGIPSQRSVKQYVDNSIAAALGALPTGKVLQIVAVTKSDAYVNSASSFQAITGLNVSITPSSTSSKILLLGMVNVGSDNNTNNMAMMRLVCNGGDIDASLGAAAGSRMQVYSGGCYFGANSMEGFPVVYMHEPASVAEQVYSINIKGSNGAPVYCNRSHSDSNNSINPRGSSTLLAIEIAGD